MTLALEVRGLVIEDTAGAKLVSDVSLEVASGSVTAVVGESGSGKTLTALAVIGLLPHEVRRTAGSIRVGGVDVTALPPNALRAMRGRDVAMIFQEPMTALNPVLRIDRQLLEARRRRVNIRGRQAVAWCHEALARVGIAEPDRVARCWPHELSGGMRQRVLIAMGLAAEPRLVLADEPTTALDAVNRREVLDGLAAVAQGGAGVVLITHDLPSAGRWADQIIVMRGGVCCEAGPAREVLKAPKHPYTRGLLDCVPRPDRPGPLPEIAASEAV
ncbi:MAG: ABC transporter ATP-binding protein [Phycisphaerales bacterium]|jgi:ABC-type dipeptide/oligopeptide/nickel transport system ATPase component|nr:ABC transporter ATP-binding protein [Phycisphaerales bacterium]